MSEPSEPQDAGSRAGERLTRHVSYAAEGGVAQVRLTRPEARNALSVEQSRGLIAAMKRIESDLSVRAVVLAGEGPWFCAGGDLKSFASGGVSPETADLVHESLTLIHRSPVPVIAAIAGGAIGYGLGLASACDIRIAEAGTRFQVGFTGVGLSPDSTTSYFLPRLLGMSTARAMMLTNEPISPERLHALGYLWQLVDAGGAVAAATALATRIGAMPSGPLTRAKRILSASLDNTLEDQIALEVENIMASLSHPDFLEGVTAFSQGRAPSFAREREPGC